MKKYVMPRRKSLLSLSIASASLLTTPTFALELPINDDSEFSGNLDITVGYATAIRAEDRQSDPNFLGRNELSELRTPDKGDQFSDVYSASFDLDIDWKNYGLVVSGTYQYDSEIADEDGIDPLSTGLITQTASNGRAGAWSNAAEVHAGKNFSLLDSYLYGALSLGGNPLDLRLGKQVINWGEGLFFLDGVSTQTPLNISKLTTPGTEFKQAFVGVNSIYGQLAVGNTGELSAYYQTEWRRSELPIAGTQFGVDPLYRGSSEPIDGSLVALGFDALGATSDLSYADSERKPDDDGQWGIAYRDVIASDYEYGLYYTRYHEKLAFFESNFDATAFTNSGGNACSLTSLFCANQFWPEDIDMFGISLATTVGQIALAGEIAYRPDRPLVDLNAGIGAFGAANGSLGVSERDTLNFTINALWVGGQTFLGIDSQQILTQFGIDQISGNTSNITVHQSVTRDSNDRTVETNETADSTAYGVAAQWTGTWFSVIPGTDLSLVLFLQHDIEGYSHFYGNFAEGRTQFTSTLKTNIGNEWEITLGYTRFDQDESDYEDLDSFQFSANYKF